jgi:hypothetical protein
MSYMDFWAQPQGNAQGPVWAAPGSLCAPGHPGELAGLTLLVGLRQHFALPVPGEFPAEIGVREHGLLPMSPAVPAGLVPHRGGVSGSAFIY